MARPAPSRPGSGALLAARACLCIAAMRGEPHPEGIDLAAQAASLPSHPALLWRVALAVAAHQAANGLPYAREFVGELGALDVAPAASYLRAAWVVLALALVLTRPPPADRRARLAVLAALPASCAGLFGVQSLMWTPVGSHLVEGVQGRYFLPLALFVPLVLPCRRVTRGRWTRPACVTIAAFPGVSVAVAGHALMHRYYL